MADRQTNPIDYASPPPAQRRPPITSIGLTLYLAVVSTIFYVLTAIIIPSVVKTLADFNATVPAITALIITCTRWLITFPGITLFVIVPVLLPMLMVRFIRAGGPEQMRWRRRLAYLSISLLAAVVAVVAILAVVLPWTSLMDGLGRAK